MEAQSMMGTISLVASFAATVDLLCSSSGLPTSQTHHLTVSSPLSKPPPSSLVATLKTLTHCSNVMQIRFAPIPAHFTCLFVVFLFFFFFLLMSFLSRLLTLEPSAVLWVCPGTPAKTGDPPIGSCRWLGTMDVVLRPAALFSPRR